MRQFGTTEEYDCLDGLVRGADAEVAVGIGHGALIFEVHGGAYASEEIVCFELDSQVDGETIIRNHAHARVGGKDLLDLQESLVEGEEGLLSDVLSHCDDDLVEER